MEIVKYMSLMQFMSICESKKMFLSRIDRWDDKREAVMIQALVQKTKLDANMEKELCKCIPSLLYAQSWYSVCDESELMWRSYARDNGIRIVIDSGKVSEDIKKAIISAENGEYKFIGGSNLKYTKNNQTPVEYSLEKDGEKMIKTALLYKSDAYIGEKEFRYMAYDQRGWNKLIEIIKCVDDGKNKKIEELKEYIIGKKDIIEYEINLASIKEIRLNPLAKKYEDAMISNYCSRMNLSSVYSQSTLYHSGLD